MFNVQCSMFDVCWAGTHLKVGAAPASVGVEARLVKNLNRPEALGGHRVRPGRPRHRGRAHARRHVHVHVHVHARRLYGGGVHHFAGGEVEVDVDVSAGVGVVAGGAAGDGEGGGGGRGGGHGDGRGVGLDVGGGAAVGRRGRP